MIQVTVQFLVRTILVIGIVGFGAGRLSGVEFQRTVSEIIVDPVVQITSQQRPGQELPHPILSPEKESPTTVYSSKHFDIGVVFSSDTILTRSKEAVAEIKDFAESRHELEIRMDGAFLNASTEGAASSDIPKEEIHEPAGQHLLVDIKFVDSVFLNSESRLANAMVELISMSGLTMLSYHCHGLPPVGVSCVGVLMESHISFHTWPVEGVSTLMLIAG